MEPDLEDSGRHHQPIKAARRASQPRRKNLHHPLVQPWGAKERKKYKPGYPLYSALLGVETEFQNFRRFSAVRMRMLLLKQDRISLLEAELNSIDNGEEAELFLGNCRRDRNDARRQVFEKLDAAFKDYDDFLQRTQWAVGTPLPKAWRVRQQSGWINGSIAAEEEAYLDAPDCELMNMGDQGRDYSRTFRSLIIKLMRFWAWSRSHMGAPNDPEEVTADGYFFWKPAAYSIFRALIASLTIAVLLIPVILLNIVQSIVIKFVIIFLASSAFVGAVTALSGASLAEVFVGGATYTAVLVVFVSQGGVSGS